MTAEGYVAQVTMAVYAQVETWARAQNEPLSSLVERAHQALWIFMEHYHRTPERFVDVADGVGTVWATFRNLGLWTGPQDVSLDGLDFAAPDPTTEILALDAPPPGSIYAPARVVADYYAAPSSPHSGRLSLTEQEVAAIRAVADVALGDAGYTVSTEAYQVIAERLDLGVERLKKVYYNAKAAFAQIYYIVGALGPDDALKSVEALDKAVVTFRQRFRGQNQWSQLTFAARSAQPKEGFASVDPSAYGKAIDANPDQAERLGWRPGGPEPAALLHRVERQAAEAFGQPHPKCVYWAKDCPTCSKVAEGAGA